MRAEPAGCNRIVWLAAEIAGHLIVGAHIATIELRLQFSVDSTVGSIVDDTGIEPVTPSMSRKCATAALIVRM